MNEYTYSWLRVDLDDLEKRLRKLSCNTKINFNRHIQNGEVIKTTGSLRIISENIWINFHHLYCSLEIRGDKITPAEQEIIDIGNDIYKHDLRRGQVGAFAILYGILAVVAGTAAAVEYGLI